ncbi:MAG: transposase [Candidatus Geothermincolia bacterium]
MRRYRIKAPKTIYHITSRGNGGQGIFLDDPDRLRFMAQVGRIVRKMGWRCHAYCLMGNHYHLLIETDEENLSKGVQQLNGRYAQTFNVRYGRSGHLFQDRFDSNVVDTDEYFMIVASYIALNPVKARIAHHPGNWPWSSYRQTAQGEKETDFLEPAQLLLLFDDSIVKARTSYQEFIETCLVVLMDGRFAGKESALEGPVPTRPQLEDILKSSANRKDRNSLIAEAYFTHGYNFREIGNFLGMSISGIRKITMASSEKVQNKVQSERPLTK